MKSGTYSTTIALRAGTENTISNIVIPPTVSVNATEIDPGDLLTVSGYGPELSVITAMMQQFGNSSTERITRASTTAGSDGSWSIEFDTGAFTTGTYEVSAEAELADGSARSEESPSVLVGIGEAPQGDLCPRADINDDSSVNLTDFSILLFNWNTTDPVANINSQGLVDLTDFSILLFCWTG